jgi:hypothetical protein
MQEDWAQSGAFQQPGTPMYVVHAYGATHRWHDATGIHSHQTGGLLAQVHSSRHAGRGAAKHLHHPAGMENYILRPA